MTRSTTYLMLISEAHGKHFYIKPLYPDFAPENKSLCRFLLQE
uniref:Uncharacterized protein n=1 Tax=Brassica oleracea TaxID=3712 RepID=A0A3P6F5Y0_BRAOL|nr:unnamed protein product [Brassica oleracea]